MSKEKQIEEMAEIITSADPHTVCKGQSCLTCEFIYIEKNCYSATALYNAGFRKQEWISVDERLPDGYGVCLVLLKQSGYENLAYFDVRPYADGEWRNLPDKLTVSHWMPLPEPPKMKGGAE